MNVRDLIEELKKYDAKLVVPLGFGGKGHSDRGSYADLAFELRKDVTIGSMVECLKKRLGTTMQGYKGGEFSVGEYTTVKIGEDSSVCGEDISSLLVEYMAMAARQ